MIIKITTKNGEIETDVARFTAHPGLRAIMLHNHNGTIDCYNMDYVEKFTVPIEAIKGVS